MKQLFLKVQARAVTLENVIKHNRQSRNEWVDEKKQARKDRDEDMFAYASKQIAKLDEDLITLEAQYQECLREFHDQRHEVGKIRLDLYIFADAIYNRLIEYEEFRRLNVANPDADNDVVNALRTAIDSIKKLPFEIADESDNRINELYNSITERFITKWTQKRDDIIADTMWEIDQQRLNKTKKYG